MEQQSSLNGRKPYDLRARLLVFACSIVNLAQYLNTRGRVASALSDQVLRSATSAGANFEEMDDGSSDRDKLAKALIALREMKETRFRLRVLHETALLGKPNEPLVRESDELVKILATIVRKLSARLHPPS